MSGRAVTQIPLARGARASRQCTHEVEMVPSLVSATVAPPPPTGASGAARTGEEGARGGRGFGWVGEENGEGACGRAGSLGAGQRAQKLIQKEHALGAHLPRQQPLWLEKA